MNECGSGWGAMASRRVERLNEQLKREVTHILRHGVKDPRVTGATVTAVETSPDLTFARVYVIISGDDAARSEVLEGLRAASPYIRGELGRELHIRRVPELHFELDRSLDHAMRIERLLKEAMGEESGYAAGGDEDVDGLDER